MHMEEKLDVLNRDAFISKVKKIVEILADKKRGCCFAIDGAWGSGKTYVLEIFENQLKKIQLEENADNKYFVFHYDCWKYDYYEEPSIAIVSAMLEAADKEISLFSEEVNNVLRLSWETTKNILAEIARELCKNKVGIDLVTVAEKTLENHDKEEIDNFDSLYGFKKALEETRKSIQKIAEDKTVVIVVDELDRCLPEYSIKVLERLHHIFTDLNNVIVIVSMDKMQLEHSIKGIYGDIDVDVYLRKLIAFKIDLDNGITSSFGGKFASYFSMFDISLEEGKEIEMFFSDILVGLDMRTQERIFNKAELIHTIVKDDENADCSIMTFEILYLTVALKTKRKHLRWLSKIWSSTYVDYRNLLGEQYYNMLNEYGKKVCSNAKHNDQWIVNDTLIGKTFFWLANLYEQYNQGECKPYFYGMQAQKRVEVVHRFADLVDVIDSD